MIWLKVSLILFIFFVSVMISKADIQEPNLVQQAVIKIDRSIRWALEETDKLSVLNNRVPKFIPLDDFKVTFKPKIIKSIKKGEFRYIIGFKFTF